MDYVTTVIVIVLIIIAVIIFMKMNNYEFMASVPKNEYLDDIPIYIINLEVRPNKKKKTQEQLAKNKLSGTFIKAFDGRFLNLHTLRQNGIITESLDYRSLRRGEIGCYLSHLNCWNLILQSGKPYGIVFEDDVVILPYFRKKFNDVFAHIKDIQWDIIQLGRRCKENWFDKDCQDGEIIYKNAFYPAVVGYGAFAYVIKASTIKRLLETTFPIYKPIDVVVLEEHDAGNIKVVSFLQDLITVKDVVHSDTIGIK